MELSMAHMGGAFLLSLLLGVAFGLCYDPLRILRIVRRKRRGGLFTVLTAMEDFLLLSFYGACFSVFVYAVNDGVVRFFMLLGAALGFSAYYFTVGRIVMAASERIIAFLGSAFRFLCKRAVLPICRILLLVYNHTVLHLIRLLHKIYIFFLSLLLRHGSMRDARHTSAQLSKSVA